MSDKVMKDLQDAFAGESQANRKYLAFADQADKDGFPGVAKMFRAIASAETLHAHSHLRTLGGVKSTAENLKGALEGETHRQSAGRQYRHYAGHGNCFVFLGMCLHNYLKVAGLRRHS